MSHRTADTSGAKVVVRRHDETPDAPRRSVTTAAAFAALILLIALGVVGASPSDDVAPFDEIAVPAPEREAIDWTLVAAPEETVRLESLLATDAGFAMLAGPSATGATMWSSLDGITWSANGLAATPYGLVTAGDGLVAFREYESVELEWNGSRWVEQATTELPTYARGGYQSSRTALVHSAAGVLVHSVEGELFYSEDGETFDLVVERGEWWKPSDDVWERFTGPVVYNTCSPPWEGTLDYPPVLDTPAGFVAFVPVEKSGLHLTWPVCEPQLWFSASGYEWSPLSQESTFAPGSYVYDAAGSAGRYFAVGGRGDEPAAWDSDDGLTWSGLDWFSGGDPSVLTDVVTGKAGYVILGSAPTGPRGYAWFSGDGSCWLRLPENVHGVAAAVGEDRIVLADRRPAAALWVGIIDQAVEQPCDIGPLP